MELVVNFWTRGKTFSITFKNERHVPLSFATICTKKSLSAA